MKEIRYYDFQQDQNLQLSTDHFENIHIGNPISVYKDEKERDFDRFLLKPNTLMMFLENLPSVKEYKKIRILELGCGNGSNSRTIANLIQNINPEINIEVTYCDASSILLKEADSRSTQKSFNWNLIQINFSNTMSLKKFSQDFKESFDLVYSVKFLHNAPLRINREMAKVISNLISPRGIFLLQTCNENGITDLKKSLKFILNKTYGNSSTLDRIMMVLNLKKSDMDVVYKIKSYSLKELNFLNHFSRNITEYYFVKKIKN